MQNYSDLKLQCCDCEENFSSASRLLRHFAEHVKQGKLKHAIRKKKRVKGEAESGSDSNQSQQTASTSSSNSSELNPHQQCKLARFDLQKRLESSVVTIKQELETDTFVSCDTIKNEPPDDSGMLDLANVSADTKESEEYNPIRFCMITMEENADSNNTGSPKKVASRKQLLPKKIERKMEGLRKLAPKPEIKVVSNDSVTESSQKKKYACHLCTKVFGWSTDLKRHILVHTGERPFKCDNCQATFTRNFLLQKHQSKVHPCKPKDALVAKSELVEIPIVPKQEIKLGFDPIKEELAESNEDDDDDHRLVITEEADEKPLTTSLSDYSRRLKSDRRCSKLKQPDIFGVAPIKVLTT